MFLTKKFFSGTWSITSNLLLKTKNHAWIFLIKLLCIKYMVRHIFLNQEWGVIYMRLWTMHHFNLRCASWRYWWRNNQSRLEGWFLQMAAAAGYLHFWHTLGWPGILLLGIVLAVHIVWMCSILLTNTLHQGCQSYGLRAKTDPLRGWIQPAGWFCKVKTSLFAWEVYPIILR